MLHTVRSPSVLQSLIVRLEALTPESQRRWGTLSPHEMLCHLGDATDMVLRIRPRVRAVPQRRRFALKALVLWTPLRWPRGRPTNPEQDPKAGGTRPTEFSSDRARAIRGLHGIATANPGSLEPAHGVLGIMSLADWQRWAYKHTDHHLRQFGL